MTAPVIRQFIGTIPDKGQAQAAFDTNVDAFLDWQALQFAPDLVGFGAWASSIRETIGFTRLYDAASVLADSTMAYSAAPGKTVVPIGSYVLTDKEGFSYQVAASGATDQHVTTAGGVKLYVQAGADGVDLLAFGAIGNGVTDDTAAVVNFASAIANTLGSITAGIYRTSAFVTSGRRFFSGVGSGIAKFLRNGTGTGITNATADDFRVTGITIDMNRTGLGDVGGHGFSLSGDRIVIDDVVVMDYGPRISDSGGGGTGVLIKDTVGRPQNVRLSNSRMYPDSASPINIGWLFSNTDFGVAYANFVDGALSGIGYAHELKNDARHNLMWGLGTENSNVAVAFGQEGGDGADYNLVFGSVSSAVDKAVLIGQADCNLFVGILHNDTGSLVNEVVRAIDFSTGSDKNAAFAVSHHGVANTHSVGMTGSQNFAQAAVYNSTSVVRFASEARRNVMDLVHPGVKMSLFDAISNVSGAALGTSDNNVAYSHALGHFYGSLSGHWQWKESESGAAFLAGHTWRFEKASGAFLALGSDGAAAGISGLSFTAPSDTARANFWLIHGATKADDVFQVRIGTAAERFQFHMGRFEPAISAAIDLGRTARRWRDAFIDRIMIGGSAHFSSGTGSPEGVLVGGIGSLYTRRDGGASTTLYIKESGTGNTGWVAK